MVETGDVVCEELFEERVGRTNQNSSTVHKIMIPCHTKEYNFTKKVLEAKLMLLHQFKA